MVNIPLDDDVEDDGRDGMWRVRIPDLAHLAIPGVAKTRDVN